MQVLGRWCTIRTAYLQGFTLVRGLAVRKHDLLQPLLQGCHLCRLHDAPFAFVPPLDQYRTEQYAWFIEQ